jgi:hypothetical protein
MGGGASKRRRLAEEEAAAAKSLRDKANSTSVEGEFQAYQDSLQKEKDIKEREKNRKLAKKERKKNKKNDTNQNSDSDSNSEDAVYKSGRKEHDKDDASDTTGEAVPTPEEESMPPVQILNPQVFDEFSEEFKARFVEEHKLGGAKVARYRNSRFKKVNKVKMHSMKSTPQEMFDVAAYRWLQDLALGSTTTPWLQHSSSSPPTEVVADGAGPGIDEEADKRSVYLVDAKNRSIASLKEINKTHLDATCAALDLSSNRFNEIHFKHTLTHLQYLNVSGNLLVSLEGVHCCKKLKVSISACV